MLSGLEDWGFGLESNLQKLSWIPNPEAIEILHFGSYVDDSAFRDENSSLRLCRRLIYRRLIPLCTIAKSPSGLVPGDVGKIPRLQWYISICRAFSRFLGEVSQPSVNTMDLVSSQGFLCESFYNASHTPTPISHNYDLKPRGQAQKPPPSSSLESSG